MENLFNKLNEKVNDMLQDKTSVLSKIMKKLENKSLRIPITQEMLSYAFNRKEIEGITNLNIKITEETIVISGVASKLLMKINFSIELKPKGALKRVLSWEVVDMKPVNHEWIKNKVLNKPPFLNYQNGVISMDLNQLDNIKAIPVGTIKDFFVQEQKLWVDFGL